MTNAGVRGRPIASLVLSAQERAYLERQVRRQRVARSLSERCRVILRCADGLPSKSVAAELGLHEHTVGKCVADFWRIAAMVCLTRLAPAVLELSTTIRLLP
jgi:DNA-binding CsgD family transcriptional regulator